MHKACPLSELAPGEALRLDTAPPIAVFHREAGEIFAIDDTCTHQDAQLTDGYVEDRWVECAFHASGFNLRTGALDAPSPNCRCAPTKCEPSTATSSSSNRTRPPTFRPD